eukprot:CAMPEP_0202868122 /NCGR_PEP_ID=MMETSP1391-20130828/10244_1 /ASSEMBLY_ACC=CAM_ASM_000867 /TAXON_ID=1034604 /ORGANISM="Chlamydomonas leiostraca, Strain SAG 11-49" /LENGTH=750 /DNA_ID=CAMNT_0049548243 /DNA_START=115 /DNA_END=2367 /DNA_ORIENTATION=+
MADADLINLRPVVLKPGGGPTGNPFASFGKGAGFAIQAKKASTVSTVDDSSYKRTGERIKYSREFLMSLMEKHTKCPIEVQQLGLTEIVISEESERDALKETFKKVADDMGLDERDWRAREPVAAAPAPKQAPAAAAQEGNWEKAKQTKEPSPAAEPKPQAAPAAPQPANEQVVQAAKIVKASDQGLQAYKPGAALSSEERSIRQVKGVLNKLTPEKFERLLQQLLEVITTADVLKHTITLVFENAVEQPTYCAMYADLCLHLSKELPSFPPPAGSDKPVAFRQILLNTCQDEFEEAMAQREALAKLTDPAAREEADRGVKKRVMGNMRLISELYKLDMVKDWIITACLEELLVAPKGRTPPEDSVEAACEMISTAGARLAKAERQDTRRKLDEVMRGLERLAAEKGVAARIRFIIKDVQDLRRANWVPRRETFTAKKLDEVRAQAEAELGMIPSTIALALPTLPTLGQRAGGGMVDDVPLIPPLRGGDNDGWGLFPPLRSQGGLAGAGGSKSALLGDFAAAPAQPSTSQPAAKAGGAPAAPAAAAGSGSDLSDEELKRKTESLFQEYTSTLDKAEALQCVRELSAPGFMPRLVEVCLDLALNSIKDKERDALLELLLHLNAKEVVSATDIVSGLATYTVQLEDLSMDFPKGPQQLGGFLGAAVASGALSLEVLPQLLEGDASAEPKRNFGAAALKVLKEKVGGDEGLANACSAVDLHAEEMFKPDPELDAGLPSTAEWLASEGLSSVPL